MFRRLRSGLLTLILIYVVLQLTLEGLRPIMPYVIILLVLGGILYMVIGRATRL
jgi:hypothetical protein